MGIILILCLLILTTTIAYYIGNTKNSCFSLIIFFSSIVFLLLLIPLYDIVPITARADAQMYYHESLRNLETLRDWFDFSQFSARQGGYSLLVTWIGQIVGESLYFRVAVNIFFFLFISIVWFKIGLIINDKRLGYIFATGILLLTPLWYYWTTLSRELAVILLQSLFLMSLMAIYKNGESLKTNIVILIGSTFFLIPFRGPLVALNITVFILVILTMNYFQTYKISKFKITIIFLLFISIFYFFSNPDYMDALGAEKVESLYQLEAIGQRVERYGEGTGLISRLTFFLRLLFIEVQGFNPNAWSELNPNLLRGLLVIPWILFGLPFFLIGIFCFLRNLYKHIINKKNKLKIVNQGNIIHFDLIFYWVILMIYLIIYTGALFFMDHTTRWAMPALTVMFAFAVYGWLSVSFRDKLLVFAGWSNLITLSFFIYHIFI